MRMLTFQTKIILLMIGVVMLFGFTYLFLPITILATFRPMNTSLIVTPIGENFNFIALAYVLLLLGLGLMAWRQTKGTIACGILSALLFFGFLFVSTMGYFAIDDEAVTFKQAHKEQRIPWDELTKVVYDPNAGGLNGSYQFQKGSISFTIDASGQFSYGIQQAIEQLATEHDVPFEKYPNKH